LKSNKVTDPPYKVTGRKSKFPRPKWKEKRTREEIARMPKNGSQY